MIGVALKTLLVPPGAVEQVPDTEPAWRHRPVNFCDGCERLEVKAEPRSRSRHRRKGPGTEPRTDYGCRHGAMSPESTGYGAGMKRRSPSPNSAKVRTTWVVCSV